MAKCDLKAVTGRQLKEWFDWLRKENEGCGSVVFATTDKYRYCVCMGWRKVAIDDGPGKPVTVGNCTLDTRIFHEEWRTFWKIGRQTHNNIMQCDFDIDFEMPYVTEKMAKADPKLVEGDVDDTSEEVVCNWKRFVKGKWEWGRPEGYRDWNALAAYVRKQARRVYRDWRNHDE